MNITVGVTPIALAVTTSDTPLIQNLGPGVIYFDADPSVDATSGIKLAVNAMYEFPRDLALGAGVIYLVSTIAATDVRVLSVG